MTMRSVGGKILLIALAVTALAVFGVATLLEAGNLDGKVSLELNKDKSNDEAPGVVIGNEYRLGTVDDEACDEADDEADDEMDDEADDEMDDEMDDCLPSALFGVQDTDLADSTLLRFGLIDPVTGHPIFDLTATWPCGDCDIEGMALDHSTGMLYGIAGGDGTDPVIMPGDLVSINKTTMEATKIANTGIGTGDDEFVSASWRSTEAGQGLIWAFVQNVGLFTIDVATGFPTLQASIEANWEGLAWTPDGSLLYGTEGSSLYSWNPVSGVVDLVCDNLVPGGEVEALEYDTEGYLIGSRHETMPSLVVIMPPDVLGDPCEVLEVDIPNVELLTDLEALAFEACPVTPGSCDDGKPKELVFRYTGDSCMATTNWQEGSFTCSGDPKFAEPVEVVITRDAADADVIPDSETIMVGGEVRIRATGDRLKSNTYLDIRQKSMVLQSLKIHTSCSKPLAVGDQFGSLYLQQFIAEDD